ncbi:outer membrane transport energization protein ExbD [Mucilaginibacter gracilis]|uniref:Outer membrane transport energization protein ExbD n=1 Tax=Mucilaginibacter gracilis TaxID=423350 RepID=A0A495IWX3_9SPHI|nr:biopolymer transporter ExbD [Mucilaginibacter gracilis]RKR81236.1 outer membrane transport energization protein ExbD [Mucilaginibacter gracilis]
MAELDSSGGGKHKGGKVRSKKSSTRVDMTAMVDLAFLLITFFILSTTLNKPKAMDLAMPDKDENKTELPVAASRTMTVLLGSNNKLEWFVGEPGKTPGTVDNYGKDGLRKALIENSEKVRASHGGQPMIVLIKPSDKSTYENLVAALDELNITKIDIHAIVDITPVEVNELKNNKIY